MPPGRNIVDGDVDISQSQSGGSMNPWASSALDIGSGLASTALSFGLDQRAAGEQRDWLEDERDLAYTRYKRMRANAIQVRVKDMRKAGLNPILAAGGPGAATQMPGTPTSGSSAVGAGGKAVASGLVMSRLRSQKRLDRTAADHQAASAVREEATAQAARAAAAASYDHADLFKEQRAHVKDQRDILAPAVSSAKVQSGVFGHPLGQNALTLKHVLDLGLDASQLNKILPVLGLGGAIGAAARGAKGYNRYRNSQKGSVGAPKAHYPKGKK